MTQEIPTGLTHATAVAIKGSGLLIVGASGSGKSGLALQLLALGAKLVSDDQVNVLQTPKGIELRPPETLAGKIESRFLGILRCDYLKHAPLCLVVDLDKPEMQRLPEKRAIAVGTVQIDLIYGANVPNLASALCVKLG